MFVLYDSFKNCYWFTFEVQYPSNSWSPLRKIILLLVFFLVNVKTYTFSTKKSLFGLCFKAQVDKTDRLERIFSV